MLRRISFASVCLLLSLAWPAQTLCQSKSSVLFENVRIYDGKSKSLSTPVNVLVKEHVINDISTETIQADSLTTVFQCDGKILMPGLVDVHVHLVYGSLTMPDLLNPELSEEMIIKKASIEAEKMLLRGFTSVRDIGGPIFPLKSKIDNGTLIGPRIWAAGATISQTAGHGDLRTPDERSRRFFGKVSRAEMYGGTFIADGRAEVLTAVRENLRSGASFIKLMAGGGTSSAYDPVDVTQYTLDEMKAAVEAAEDWGTYVAVHAYTPRAVQRAIEAGVKCVEHGQLLDKNTLKLMKRKNVWLSLQNLMESNENMDPMRVEKRKPIIEGQPKVWELAKQIKVKLAWGTDFLFEPELNEEQNKYILPMLTWFTPAEILKIVTYDNVQLLQLSGLRSPYTGKLGVVEKGALADLILVDGNPLEDLSLIANPAEKFLVIMKDGQVYKNKLD